MSAELSVKVEQEMKDEEKKPTHSGKSGKEKMEEFRNAMIERYNDSEVDMYMLVESFIFLLSFFFLIGEDNDSTPYAGMLNARMYLFYVNAIFMLDFFFRMLSMRIESFDPKYWTPAFNCVFPMIMWLLAAYFDFDYVFGGEAVQVLNLLLFLFMNILMVMLLVMKYVSLNRLKECFKCKREENNEPQEKRERNDDLELGEAR